MFSVYDEKAHAYFAPTFVKHNDIAVRAFSDCVNDPEHNFGMHPGDYTLFCVGDFQDSNGAVSGEGGVRSCGNGLEFVRGFTEPVADRRTGLGLIDGEDQEVADPSVFMDIRSES